MRCRHATLFAALLVEAIQLLAPKVLHGTKSLIMQGWLLAGLVCVPLLLYAKLLRTWITVASSIDNRRSCNAKALLQRCSESQLVGLRSCFWWGIVATYKVVIHRSWPSGCTLPGLWCPHAYSGYLESVPFLGLFDLFTRGTLECWIGLAITDAAHWQRFS